MFDHAATHKNKQFLRRKITTRYLFKFVSGDFKTLPHLKFDRFLNRLTYGRLQ